VSPDAVHPHLEWSGPLLKVRGAMTLTQACALEESGFAGLQGGAVTVDLSAATEIDSSALAVLFSWQRTQQRRGGSLGIVAAPEALQTLARVYGVTDQLSWV
jgi:phospholipid transport system transporter-binding protein